MADNKWYRYEDYLEGRGYTDESGEYVHSGSTLRVRLWVLPVDRVTRCGAWVDGRFINRSWRKRYAAPTREAALADFIARKKRQINIYETRLADARRALDIGLRHTEVPTVIGPLTVLKPLNTTGWR